MTFNDLRISENRSDATEEISLFADWSTRRACVGFLESG
jgi:hypothetical protein